MFMSVETVKRMSASVLCVLFGVLLFAEAAGEEFPAAGDIRQGAKTWADNCARCHNLRNPRELRDDQWITTVFHMRIRAGLTGQQARDVLSFLQVSNSSAGAEFVSESAAFSPSASGASGASIYGQTCVACHGRNGKGAIPGVPDLTRAGGPLSQSNDVLLDHMARGFRSPGSQLAMPPRGGNPALTDADLQAVLTYLRQTFGG